MPSACQALAGAVDVLALLDRSALVLGASGIGFAVLGALLYSSRAEIRCAAENCIPAASYCVQACCALCPLPRCCCLVRDTNYCELMLHVLVVFLYGLAVNCNKASASR